jgi:hypothetical protein
MEERKMFQFLDDPHSPIGWAICIGVAGLLLVWLWRFKPPEQRRRKEEEWPFGEDPGRKPPPAPHFTTPADLAKHDLAKQKMAPWN